MLLTKTTISKKVKQTDDDHSLGADEDETPVRVQQPAMLTIALMIIGIVSIL